MSERINELNRRRTFAIISHPDAGKTTLTEKLLLFGGAIQIAGAVKSKKTDKAATSDFMEIERQRGISVATSVMGFEYNKRKVNILDTPGHQDFSEDTYRTLTAVDSAIMVIDCVKGVEPQTEKLAEVCRMRNTPIITFINKMDREGQDPFDLLDELEQKLNIKVKPLSWPIGIGKTFQGVYNISENKLVLFQSHTKQSKDNSLTFDNIHDEALDKVIGKKEADLLREEVEMVEGVYPKFDLEAYREAGICPVFFGSALNNFGVKELLDCFVDIAPPPQARETGLRLVKPEESKFSGFVFKIHANMNPKHRDRIAFVRICSGMFERNKNYLHVRLDKQFKYSSPTAFLAQDKEIVDVAYPGDIIGLHDTGNFRIGDTLTEGEKFFYKGIPSFSPELFKSIVNRDPSKTKQLNKGIEQLMDEGVAQLFTNHLDQRKVIGAVGQLQFEVIQHRLLNEYGASCEFENVDVYKACWIDSDDTSKLEEFVRLKKGQIATDKHGQYVFLAPSQWILNVVKEDFPDLNFAFTSEIQNFNLAE
ncbi:MAG: peptide chain release factor 3 [Chitinophagaceae bacterium]|nr:MAG: peptide chain release factor 3 [Chitinophagaceae bacterium]